MKSIFLICTSLLLIIGPTVGFSDTMTKLEEFWEESLDSLSDAKDKLLEQSESWGESLEEQSQGLVENLKEKSSEFAKELEKDKDTVMANAETALTLRKSIKSLSKNVIELKCQGQSQENKECWKVESHNLKQELSKECGKLPSLFNLEAYIENQECRESHLTWAARKQKLLNFF